MFLCVAVGGCDSDAPQMPTDARVPDGAGGADPNDPPVSDARVGDSRVGDARVRDSRVGDARVTDARVTDVGDSIDGGDAAVVDGEQLWTVVEWSLPNPSYEGNAFDLVASVTFSHPNSQAVVTTEMFYAGADTWKFRFTGTALGQWTYITRSDDPDLDGHAGEVTVIPPADPNLKGFVSRCAADPQKWCRPVWAGGEIGAEAFIPQFVMYRDPVDIFGNDAVVDAEIESFFVDHGFNGLHTNPFCAWFDLENGGRCNNESEDSNPDPRTFEALEMIISKAHRAGGLIHIWMYGDDARRQNPNAFGVLNGAADQRVQRYIAARLGPLPNWTLGYGFDTEEWATQEEIETWQAYLQSRFGWHHYLGARDQSLNQTNQRSERLDYSGYEYHHPSYVAYVEQFEDRPNKPSFSEDRFRSGRGRGKDPTDEESTRMFLYSYLCGGVANIWAYLANGGALENSTLSSPYPSVHNVKTPALIYARRYTVDMQKCNALTNDGTAHNDVAVGVCIKRPTNQHYVFYIEDAASLTVDLSELASPQQAVAIDLMQRYEEVPLGLVQPGDHTFDFPRAGRWAVAVGPADFRDSP
jgi:hypothetical protein